MSKKKDMGHPTNSKVILMAKKVLKRKVVSWWKRAKYFSVELPDGIFGGRPGENQHGITFIEELEHKFIVELDNKLLLVFTDLMSVTQQGDDLQFSDFGQLIFDRQEYGTMIPRVEVYNSGTVKFLS